MGAGDWHDALIARGELYRVGGVVRDELLGIGGEHPDVDYLVRGIPPDALETLLAPLGTLTHVGRAFGVYKFTPAGADGPVDIAYPRTERSTGPGHRDFDVVSDWRLDVESDLARRDFTINAMARRVPDGALIDPFGGAADVRDRVLRVVFPAAFIEDPLRILRGARFAGRFGLAVEEETARLMAEGARGLATVSPERVREEFSGILTQCRRPSVAIDILQRSGGLSVILPELDRCVGVTQNEFHPDDVYGHSLAVCDCAPANNLAVRWAALLHDVGKVDRKQVVDDDGGERVVFYGHEDESARHTRGVLTRLRYPRAFIERCVHLVAMHMFRYEPGWRPATLRRFIRRVGIDHLADLFALREADCRSRELDGEIARLDELRGRVDDALRRQSALSRADLAIGGDDVVAILGVAPGPLVGRVLDALLDAVTEDPSVNTRESLAKLVKQFGDQRRM